MANPNVNNYAEISGDITALQKLQTNLQTQLNNGQSSLTNEQKMVLVNQIENVQTSISNLMSTTANLNSIYADNLQNNTNTLATQANALSIINNETIDANNQMAYINSQKINKMRQVEINNYYAGWYQEQTKLLTYLVYYVLIFTLLFFLKRRNILSSEIFGPIVVFVTIIFLFFIIPIILSIFRRDNMNYSEYDWGFDKSTAPKIQGVVDNSKNNILPKEAASSVVAPTTGNGSVCVGSSCCPAGSVYDKKNNICKIGNIGSLSGSSNGDFSNVFQSFGDNVSSFFSDATSYSYSN
jgi:hypothetical protein